MAKIAENLKQILSARYGRDVRQSIHDAISAINDESTECWATVEKVPETLAIAAVKDRVSGKDVTLPLSSDFVATDFKAKGNTEQFTTSGKNLLDCSGLKEQTVAGVTFTPVFDNSGLLEYINVNGANDGTSNSNYHLSAGKISLTGGKTYKVTGCPSTGSDTTYGFGVSYIGTDFGSGRIGTPAQDYTDAYVSISVFKGVTVSNVKFYPMVRYAENGDDTYEPFTNGASPNPDYPQKIKSVVLSKIKTTNLDGSLESVATLSNPITLNGIGGVQDYIDGKDNVEHHKFKYERVLGSNITNLNTSEAYEVNGYSIGTNIIGKSNGLSLSNRFIGVSYDNRVANVDIFRCYLDNNGKLTFRPSVSGNANFSDLETVKAYFDNNENYALYELAEPIETPLPDADVEALKNIRTFKGITHVFTDSEVKPDLEVEYVIDTKLYIDAKFKELS